MDRKASIFLSFLLLDFANSNDIFNYRTTSGRDYGPEDWDEVSCGNLDTCPGWPDKLEGSVGWTLTSNNCRSCPIEGNSCGQHRQSPIDLQRDRAIAGHENEKECPDWHWMQYKDGSCRFEDMLDQFEIARHALQIHTPIRSNGDIDCINEAGERKFPKLDYSKGFPDWWYLSRTDISVPSEHVQHGQRYAAEIVLSHFYEIDHYKNKLGKVSIFMQDFDDEPAWHYLDKLICQWRRVEEEKRAACGLDPAPVYKMCELYRGQERTDDDLEVPTESANNYPTRAPLVPPPAIPIANLGADPEEYQLPLQLCQGDCDFSTDCAEGLICHRRDAYESVPGCIGGETDDTNTDYCVFDPFGEGYHVPTPSPTTSPTVTARPSLTPLAPKHLTDYGGTPPVDKFPLQLCEGDCDNDGHCAEGLMCYQRDELQAVPGCIGGDMDIQKTDYCILDPYGPGYVPPPTENPTDVPTQIPSQKPSALPTDAPQTDSPTQNPVAAPTTELPSNSPSEQPTMLPTKLPTPPPTRRPTGPMQTVNNLGWEPPVPLGECEGDCDVDADCGPGMYCFQRHSVMVPVPGCLGGEREYTLADFCTYGYTNPPISHPSKEPSRDPTTYAPSDSLSQAPTALASDEPTTAPSGEPSASPSAVSSSEPSASPSGGTTEMKMVVNDGWSPVNPLGECHGDCDDDDDCSGDLMCYQRESQNIPVPGCMGGENDAMLTDYCILPSNFPVVPTSAPNTPFPTKEPSATPTSAPAAGTPSSNVEPIPINNLGWSPPDSVMPLGRCEGDCDIDIDCGVGLVCYQRYLPHKSIPGCIGGEADPTLTDYCVIDPEATSSPVTEAAPVTPAPVTPAPITDAPATPSPVTPAPITPAPVTPSPVTPAPVTPAPVTPAPVTPEQMTPPQITCDDYEANFFRMCKDNSCCRNPRSTSDFCEETYAILGDVVPSACHWCCIEERGFPFEVGPDPNAPAPTTPSPVAPPTTPAPVVPPTTPAPQDTPAPVTPSGVPPAIDCDHYDVNFYRMCKDDSCCSNPRSSSEFCFESYLALGDKVESACHHCCIEERGMPLEVGPPAMDNPNINQVVSCGDPELNAARMCKADSCCDGFGLDDDSGFCVDTLANVNSATANTRDRLSSICWYCCFPSKEITFMTPWDHRVLPEIASPEESAVQNAIDGALVANVAQSASTTATSIPPLQAKLKKEMPKRIYNETRDIGENDVITHDVAGRKIIVREENFEDKGVDDEDEYFDKMYTEFRRRMQSDDNLATENYGNVFWWPYEWLLKVGTEYYFRYEGTQTVPPCYEKAHWRVLKDPIRVASHQMRELERLIAWRLGDNCQVDTAGKPREGNPEVVDVNRPLQGYHKLHRMVFCECQDWPSKFPQDREWCRNWRTREPEQRLFDRPYNFRSDGFDFLN